MALDGEALGPVELIEKLEVLAGSYGIGRGIHLGDTVLGTKGRVAFEAPAAITLITAHRELEKLVLSAQQARIKDSVAAIYGDLVHEGQQLLVMDAMKMEHVITASTGGLVLQIAVSVGDAVYEGHPLLFIEKADIGELSKGRVEEVDLDAIRPDLAEVQERHSLGFDAARPEAEGGIDEELLDHVRRVGALLKPPGPGRSIASTEIEPLTAEELEMLNE